MPTSKLKKIKTQAVTNAVKLMLEALGFDLRDQDLRETPKRVAKMLIDEVTPKTGKKLFNVFNHTSDVLVVLNGHECYTRCPHHLERVKLKIWIGYITNKKYIGVSKLARIANYFSRGLMLQEEIVTGIAEGLTAALKPKGVAVIAVGDHLCMKARGVRTNASITTSKMTGVFLEDSHVGIAAREEFLTLVKGGLDG